MSQVIDDATFVMHDAYDDTTALLNNTVPPGEFLDEQLARVRENEITETEDYDAPQDMNCLLYLRVML